MPQALLSPQANLDLSEIWLYIAQDSTDAADRWVERLKSKCDQLAEHPTSVASATI